MPLENNIITELQLHGTYIITILNVAGAYHANMYHSRKYILLHENAMK
jgi:hypothetical protein